MKIALDWIADYLSPTPSAQSVADALMNAGLPVESITDAPGVKSQTKILDVEVTSNRTDCFSHVGLAREISALTGGTFSLPKIILTESGDPSSSSASLTIAPPILESPCPYYSARILRNVKVGPSPDWLIKRLESIGLRSINNIVDVTNFVLMELGQPLHAFDLDKLAGKKITVRHATKNEKLTAIDGKDYPLTESMLLIADAQKPVAIAGIMGGKNTEVTNTTTNILLESARFDPLSIRTTSRALGLKSDSSYRFERGIDPTMPDTASKRAAQLILQVAGGQLAPGAITLGESKPKSLSISMRFDRFEKIVGFPLNLDRALAILCALGFPAWVNDQEGTQHDTLHTRIPPHRLDVDREIDLIEEIIRVYGYSHIPTKDRVSHPVTPESTNEKATRTILSALTQAGFSEAVTVTFIPEPEGKAFLHPGHSLIRTQHAGWKSDVLRPSILPSLLAVRRTNQNVGIPDARLFERAEVILQQGDPLTKPPTSTRILAAVSGGGDLSSLTALVHLIIQKLTPAARIEIAPTDFPFYIPGTSAQINIYAPNFSRGLGNVGIITPQIQNHYDLRHQVAGLELHWDSLLQLFQPVRRANPVPRFPGIKRDLSVVLEESIRWADIEAALTAAQLPALERIHFVTTFRNKQIGDNKKSLTLALDFRDPSRTLKSEEVDTQVHTAITLLHTKFAATLRA